MPNDEARASGHRGRLVRVARLGTRPVRLSIDGTAIEAAEGQSLLVAILAVRDRIRTLEFNGEPRAGFCLMGACQDCWVWLGDASRARACTTPVSEGMTVSTRAPEGFPRDG